MCVWLGANVEEGFSFRCMRARAAAMCICLKRVMARSDSQCFAWRGFVPIKIESNRLVLFVFSPLSVDFDLCSVATRSLVGQKEKKTKIDSQTITSMWTASNRWIYCAIAYTSFHLFIILCRSFCIDVYRRRMFMYCVVEWHSICGKLYIVVKIFGDEILVSIQKIEIAFDLNSGIALATMRVQRSSIIISSKTTFMQTQFKIRRKERRLLYAPWGIRMDPMRWIFGILILSLWNNRSFKMFSSIERSRVHQRHKPLGSLDTFARRQ